MAPRAKSKAPKKRKLAAVYQYDLLTLSDPTPRSVEFLNRETSKAKGRVVSITAHGSRLVCLLEKRVIVEEPGAEEEAPIPVEVSEPAPLESV